MSHGARHRFGVAGVVAGIPLAFMGIVMMFGPVTAPRGVAETWPTTAVGVGLVSAGWYLCRQTGSGRRRPAGDAP